MIPCRCSSAWMQRILWLDHDINNFVPYPTGESLEDSTYFQPTANLFEDYDVLASSLSSSLSTSDMSTLRSNLQDLLAFRAYFALTGDFTSPGEQERQSLLQSYRFSAFFGNFAVS